MFSRIPVPILLIGFFIVPLVQMVGWLWSRDHYQFFPLVLLGVGYLCYDRLRSTDIEMNGVSLCLRTVALTTASLALFLLAAVANSHWLGTAATMLFGWMLIWWFGGEPVVRQVRGPYLLLLLILPLPLELDRTLIVQLQKFATSAASAMLDWRDIRHLVEGVALTTPDGNFLVEEACSGIHSLFSCVTVMMFFAVYQRYGLVRTFLTLIHTVVWVVIANSFRVFLIVWSKHRFGASLEEGMLHEALGFGTYALALGLALSMDQFFRFLVQHDSEAKVKHRSRWNKKLHDWLNYPFASESTTSLLSRATLAIGFAPIMLLTLWNQAGFLRSNETASPQSAFVETIAIDEISDRLPKSVQGFTQQDLRAVSRDANDQFGSNSVIATYTGDGMTVQFSVDGFYSAWHDLGICYAAMDWRLESAENRQRTARIPEAIDGPRVWETQLDLYRNDGQRAYCLFSCFDQQKSPVTPNEENSSPMRRLLDRFHSVVRRDGRPEPNGAVFQHQLYYTTDSDLMNSEEERLRELFHALSAAALKEHADLDGEQTVSTNGEGFSKQLTAEVTP